MCSKYCCYCCFKELSVSGSKPDESNFPSIKQDFFFKSMGKSTEGQMFSRF